MPIYDLLLHKSNKLHIILYTNYNFYYVQSVHGPGSETTANGQNPTKSNATP
jgi:hypothetical protein